MFIVQGLRVALHRSGYSLAKCCFIKKPEELKLIHKIQNCCPKAWLDSLSGLDQKVTEFFPLKA